MPVPRTKLEAAAGPRADLPAFPGLSLLERAVAGEQEARARLLKYTSVVRYSGSQADAVVHEITSWATANEAQLEANMLDPQVDTLPEALALELGAKKTVEFLLAGYSHAATGLGPHLSGATQEAAASGFLGITEPWAADDLDSRTVIFATIVKLDDEGSLEQMFAAARGQATAGFGAWPVTLAQVGTVVVLGLLFIGLVATIYVLTVRADIARRNNVVLQKLCDDAVKRGDQETVDRCIELAAKGQEVKSPTDIVPSGSQLLTVAVIIGVVYLGITVGIPALKKATE